MIDDRTRTLVPDTAGCQYSRQPAIFTPNLPRSICKSRVDKYCILIPRKPLCLGGGSLLGQFVLHIMAIALFPRALSCAFTIQIIFELKIQVQFPAVRRQAKLIYSPFRVPTFYVIAYRLCASEV